MSDDMGLCIHSWVIKLKRKQIKFYKVMPAQEQKWMMMIVQNKRKSKSAEMKRKGCTQERDCRRHDDIRQVKYMFNAWQTTIAIKWKQMYWTNE